MEYSLNPWLFPKIHFHTFARSGIAEKLSKHLYICYEPCLYMTNLLNAAVKYAQTEIKRQIETMEGKQQCTDMYSEEKSFECKGNNWHGEQKKIWFSAARCSQKISGGYPQEWMDMVGCLKQPGFGFWRGWFGISFTQQVSRFAAVGYKWLGLEEVLGGGRGKSCDTHDLSRRNIWQYYQSFALYHNWRKVTHLANLLTTLDWQDMD